jgi:hypothetical protein
MATTMLVTAYSIYCAHHAFWALIRRVIGRAAHTEVGCQVGRVIKKHAGMNGSEGKDRIINRRRLINSTYALAFCWETIQQFESGSLPPSPAPWHSVSVWVALRL